VEYNIFHNLILILAITLIFIVSLAFKIFLRSENTV